jgi:hypothetical protein
MTVTRDATSLRYAPANLTEWTELLFGTGLSAPSASWGLQEAAVPVDDVIATNDQLSGSGFAFQQTIPGWARKGITMTEGGGAVMSNSTTIGDLQARSHLCFCYLYLPTTPGATRTVMGMGPGGSHRYVELLTSGLLRLNNLDGGPTATGGVNVIGTTFPILLQADKTNSKLRIVTEAEIIEPAYTAPSAGGFLFNFGIAVGTSAVAGFLFGALWTGAAAEMSAAQLAQLLLVLKNGPLPIPSMGAGYAAAQRRTVALLRFGDEDD